MARKKVTSICEATPDMTEVKALYDTVQSCLTTFHEATFKLSKMGFYTVAQKDNTLYIYKNVSTEENGVTITKTISIGKPYTGESNATNQEGKKDPIEDA